MFSSKKYDVIVIGGGLAGLVSSIRLSMAGLQVLLVEKSKYPIAKVCGEYVSNEVLRLLAVIGFDPEDGGASHIHKLLLSDQAGKVYRSQLKLGGFGISRTLFEMQLLQLAKQNGVEVVENCRVDQVQKNDQQFTVVAGGEQLNADWVIGAYGKRSSMDKSLQRDFISKRTGFIGVKYHIHADLPDDEIALHAFPNGYCGIVKIEKDQYNVCYLFKRQSEERITPEQIAEQFLSKNPHLKSIASHLKQIDNPVAISEIYFGKKSIEQDGVLFCGDAAGLITPLCGNGMSIAIHSAFLLSESILKGGGYEKAIHTYRNEWSRLFSTRMKTGRILQHLFLQPVLCNLTLKMMYGIKGLDKAIIERTHNRKVIIPEQI